MVDLYPSENLNAWNLLSVRHFAYKLLFHVRNDRLQCTWMTSFSSVHICIAFRLLRRGSMKLHALLGYPVSENFVSWCQTLKISSASFLLEQLKWLQICEFLFEIFFILFLNTSLFYNFMLPVSRYLAMNIFCRSMTYLLTLLWNGI
jgi:hypothetical protein